MDTQNLFSDVSNAAGLNLATQTWGSAFGDFDGDGFTDIWLNRHQLEPILYRNLGDGTFQDVTDEVFLNLEDIQGDFHGSSFIDIDNDGDLDVLQLAGGDQGEPDPNNPNRATRLFINTNGRYQTEERGVGYLSGRGRVGVYLDPNQDGDIDFVFTGPPQEDGSFPPTLFMQQDNGRFETVANSNLNPNVASGAFGLVSDLTGDGKLELIYAANSPRLQIYETDVNGDDVSFQDITDTLLPALSNTAVQDVVVGDFNGDGEQDLYIVRQASFSSGVREDSPRAGRARLLVNKPVQRGIAIDTVGELSLNFEGDPEIDVPQFMQARRVQPEDIKVGPTGFSPDSLDFRLERATATGRPNFVPGVDEGIYIWYEGTEWKIALSSPEFYEVNFLYRSSQIVTSIDSEIDEGEPSFPFNPVRRRASLLIREGDSFVDKTEEAGLGQAISGANAVSGDFDNDGDLDLYVVSTDLTRNLPNILYENQGDGTFIETPQAGGAAGTTQGLGDAAALSDYDNDGDLDIFLTNGDVAGFRRPFLLDGELQLFQNDLDNGNHYLLIDLEGVVSNRSAIGARVEITAGGVTQVREQNGGIHNRSQNDMRLHFGLGQNTVVDRIEILWPSGEREVITNVAADQIINIVEGSGQAVGTGGNNNGGNNNGGGGGTTTTVGNKQIIEGTASGEVLAGAGSIDVIRGKAGRDTIRGLGGNDNLFGNSGVDTIDGGSGNDLIVGNQGNDILTGGLGADKFLFNATSDMSDTITDFNVAEDVIRLRGSRFGGGLSVGSLAANQFHLGAAATQGEHRVIYNQATGQLFFDEDGNGAASAHLVATLEGLPDLTASDITIV